MESIRFKKSTGVLRLRVNVKKAKQMISSENAGKVIEEGKFSCAASKYMQIYTAIPSSASFADIDCIRDVLMEIG